MEAPRLTTERLTPVVRRALGEPGAIPIEWSCEPMGEDLVNPVTAGLFTVRGRAAIGAGEPGEWRVVLKVVQDVDLSGTTLESGYSREPEDWNYWKREALVLRTGVLERFTWPLRSVTYLVVDEPDEATAWLWMEELDHTDHRSPWTLSELAQAAHNLGAFAAQGRAALDDVRRLPWAAHRWMEGWVATGRAMGADHAVGHEGCWEHPLVLERIPANARALTSVFLHRADRLLGRLDALPQTVAHHDTQWSNLFRDRRPEGTGTVVIDWSYLGTGPVGQDLGLHIASNVFNRAVGTADAVEHAETATSAYLEGLRSHGWSGSEDDVRFAAVSSGALAMVPYAVGHLAWMCPGFGDPEPWPERLAEAQGMQVNQVMDEWCQRLEFVLRLGERAVGWFSGP